MQLHRSASPLASTRTGYSDVQTGVPQSAMTATRETTLRIEDRDTVARVFRYVYTQEGQRGG